MNAPDLRNPKLVKVDHMYGAETIKMFRDASIDLQLTQQGGSNSVAMVEERMRYVVQC